VRRSTPLVRRLAAAACAIPVATAARLPASGDVRADPGGGRADAPGAAAQLGDGPGPAVQGRLLLLRGAELQNNAVSFERGLAGLHRRVIASWRMNVDGPHGASFLLLDTSRHGPAGPPPRCPAWEEPDVPGSLAVAFEGRDSPPADMEISLHVDGTETASVPCALEYRGRWVSAHLEAVFVCGGCNVSLLLDGEPVLDDLFVPGLLPFECRGAFGARGAEERTTMLALDDVHVELLEPIEPPPAPMRVRATSAGAADGRPGFEADFTRLPIEDIGRVVATLALQEPPAGSDDGARPGAVYLLDEIGRRHELMRFAAPWRGTWRRGADVTDFLPLFRGRRRLEVFIDAPGNGRSASLDLDFHPGIPHRLPLRVDPLWRRREVRGAGEPLEAFSLDVPPDTEAATLRLTWTSHLQSADARDRRPEPACLGARVGGCDFEGPGCVGAPRGPGRTQGDRPSELEAGGLVRPWEIDVSRCLTRGRPVEISCERQPRADLENSTTRPAIDWIEGSMIFQRAPAPPPRRYICRRAAGGVAVDGCLDEPAWDAAAWSDPFVDIEGDHKPLPRFRTRVKALWDDRHLFVGADLEDPHVWASLREHDSVVWHDNDFELFLDPDGDGLRYYEIEVNALGTVFDLMLDRPYIDGGRGDGSWEARLLCAAGVDGTLGDPADTDRGWSVELAIPWAALRDDAATALPPREGDGWRVNFSRVQWRHDVAEDGYRRRPGTAEENWVWSPQGLVNMHLPRRWGWMEFAAAP
jgi:hypothetical protein